MKTLVNKELKDNVVQALDEIRPFLQRDGGDISLVEIDENSNTVKVQLEGNCANCSINNMTLKAGVEMTIKKYAPQIEKVINLED
ncbi:MAG TPA: NifU family protein [Flavobacteriaceae bacterium]|nr:NifU family protein [Flavobacteriaceae bacterium]